MQNSKISKAFFRSIAVFLGIANILIILGTINNKIELVLLSFIAILPGAIIVLILFYKMWAAIQDGHARTSPGKAIGFLFIPFFSIYWGFQAIWGFSKDYNKFIKRHSLIIRPLPEGLFLAYSILVWTTWIPKIGLIFLIINYFIFLIMISTIIDGINNLSSISELGNQNTKKIDSDKYLEAQDSLKREKNIYRKTNLFYKFCRISGGFLGFWGIIFFIFFMGAFSYKPINWGGIVTTGVLSIVLIFLSIMMFRKAKKIETDWSKTLVA